MSTKLQGVSCYDKAQEDEPIFVIRGQDITGPETLRYWLSLNPQLSGKKRAEALECALQMEKWKIRKKAD